MSFGKHRRRCIVQKLDFENCIITNFKTAARGRKKLRARITREFEAAAKESPEEPLNSSSASAETERASSPVLITKQYRHARSLAVVKRKKSNSPEKKMDELSEHSAAAVYASPNSPVFKIFKKQKMANISLNTSQNFSQTAINQETICTQETSSSELLSSFQIEEFTQDSKQSIKISSVESPVIKTGDSSCSGEAGISKIRDSPYSICFNISGKWDSPKPTRRNYKKKSLLGRLYKLQQKQASEKLLWQHQNRKNSAQSLKLSIITFWKEEFNYFFKCESPDSQTTFLIVDSRWVPNVRKIRKGAVLQLHPPWQKFCTENSAMTILLGVICLEVLEETREPISPKKTLQAVPTDQFETDRKLFIDSLFISCDSGLLI